MLKMRVHAVLGLIMAMALMAGAPLAAARTAEGADVWNSAEINWRDVPSGIKEATATGKPVVMVMHATWCSACRRYREVFKDPEVVSASRDFIMILVDVEKYPDINGGFAPDGTYVPRTLFLDAAGNINGDLIGSDPTARHNLNVDNPKELLSLMRRARPAPPPPAGDSRT